MNSLTDGGGANVEHASDLNGPERGVNCVELHRRDLREVCFPRSARSPNLTGSQRVRGSNPLSSTLAMTVARIEFLQFRVRAGST